MIYNKRLKVRITEEMYNYLHSSVQNISLFIRESIRTSIESGLFPDTSLELVEIRAKTPYVYFCELVRVSDGDTVVLKADLGFFVTSLVKVRLLGIDCAPVTTDEGKAARDFVLAELTDSTILIETQKKGKYGRYLAYVYYSKEYKEFADILRYGKLLNEELIIKGFANKYAD